jgi:DNA-directed RNA polymerase subunit RPC12/RpoP
LRYSIPTKCIRCGTSEISDFSDEYQGRIFVCWLCSHRTTAECPQSARCIHCKSTQATEFYNEQVGVVIECPDCGSYEISEQRSVEYPRVVECSQCGNTQASEFDDDGIIILCLKCGREESKSPIRDTKGNVCGWKHEVKFGAGCLQFRQKDRDTVLSIPLHTTEEAAEREEVTRERLRNGEYVESDTYLTRWDLETRQTVTVLGHFKPDSSLESMYVDSSVIM